MAFDPAPPSRASFDDTQLLERVAAGDGTAMSELYSRHAAAVYRYAWLVSGSEATAADVVQDTFVAVLEHARGFDPDRGSCAAWLCGIARHLAWRRFDGNRLPVEAIDTLPDEPCDSGAPLPLPEDAIDQARALERLRRAIRALPPIFRDILVLVELQEMSYADAAAVTGVELGTVRSRLSRARSRLLQLLRTDAAVVAKE